MSGPTALSALGLDTCFGGSLADDVVDLPRRQRLEWIDDPKGRPAEERLLTFNAAVFEPLLDGHHGAEVLLGALHDR